MRAVLLDFDGTFLNSIELIMAAFRHTFTVHHGAPPPDSEWLAGIGTPLSVQLKGLAREGDDVDELLATYRDYNIEHHDRLAQPYAGMPEVVKELRARGTLLAIVTSKRRIGVARGLRPIGMMNDFDLWVCPEDVSNPKPHPEPVWAALKGLGVERDEAIFVGDSPHDIEAGNAAGVATAAVRWGPFDDAKVQSYNPTRWLESPADLLEFATA
ncbi:MAG: HAD-IA family hydrolase [Proteobacteria bacterium]|nr:HAD-IA family hydrolase [Pseudomonadota bacterium]